MEPDDTIDVNYELKELMDYNPPFRCQDDADPCPPLKQPRSFYDKHLDAGLLLKNVQIIPLAAYLSKAVDQILEELEAKKTALPARYPGDLFESKASRRFREPDVAVVDADALADVYQATTAFYAGVTASTLLLHNRVPGWYTSLIWTRQRPKAEHRAFCDSYGLQIDIDEDSKAQKTMDETLRDALHLVQQKHPCIAVWNLFSISSDSEDMLKEIGALASLKSFDHETCQTSGYTTPPVIPFKTLDALYTGWGAPIESLSSSTSSHMGKDFPKANKDQLERKSGSRKRDGLHKPTNISSLEENRELWPQVQIPVGPKKASGLAKLFVQRAWTLSAECDTTYIVFNCGNYERIGFRHRKSQTLFLSDLIDVPRCKSPAYGKIHIGLFLAITQDVIDRTENEIKAEKPHKSRKRRQPGTALPLSKRPRTRATVSKQQHEDKVRYENLEVIKEQVSDRSLALIEIRYGVYDSPAPASFLRLDQRRKARYNSQEYISIVITSRIAAGATAVAHDADLKLLASDGKVRSTNVVVKLAFEPEQTERLRHEFEIFEHLHSRGVVDGIPFIYGIFKDTESEAHALVMSHVGTSLWTLSWQKNRSTFNLRVSETAKSAYLRTLGAIHEAGVRHRDIRPENLTLIDEDGAAIIDFDMAELNPSDGAKRREMRHMTNLLNGSYLPPNEVPSDKTTPEKKPVAEPYKLCDKEIPTSVCNCYAPPSAGASSPHYAAQGRARVHRRREMRYLVDLLNGHYTPPNEFPSAKTTPEKKTPERRKSGQRTPGTSLYPLAKTELEDGVDEDEGRAASDEGGTMSDGEEGGDPYDEKDV
ncbi:hypothetical protein H0H81_009775 [Sphagnurus paluster]|uniref:Protein kinase domain-containing protein n=1 Tax=Sphagnurus paluster TaxID=117069 RepID=A0A9P7GMB0_9AGAR|nr:hypothetical protein H0H81_009775 [Sphagnurus paluster]